VSQLSRLSQVSQMPQTFRSILFGDTPAPAGLDSRPEPAFFHDLNLDQVTGSVTAALGDYQLRPFFYAPLDDPDAVRYRHEVFRDLDGTAVAEPVTAFAAGMRRMRQHLATAQQLHHPLQQQRWFLAAVAAYCDAAARLARDLDGTAVASRGFREFRAYLAGYVRSPGFTSLAAENAELLRELSGIRYCLHIKGNRIRVRGYDAEDDYGKDVLAVFEKFRQATAKDYRIRFHAHQDMNHVEAGVLDLVAKLHPDVFAAVAGHCDARRGYLDDVIARFDREVQFYLGYLAYMRPIRAAGLEFCYPAVSARSQHVHASATFDLALAAKLAGDGGRVVSNDFRLDGAERILVVTGPNQGGKTTLARTFGQLHHLARLGCPVPGRDAALFLCDEVFTHFEKEEDLATLSGKLRDDLVRFRDILDRATARSVIVMNEIFTSTTLDDALFLGQAMLEKIIGIGALGVCVTFLDELAGLDAACVSMVATVAAANPAERTYQVVRKPADGLAYAMAIAAKYGLTYDQLQGRVRP
jgi:DNA mismatch repair protein MutS